jgi:hypothetical protein
MTDPEYIDPIHIQPGPIRNEFLPPELLELIQAVYKLIGPYLNTTLERFEIGFMRDLDPESEVAIWCNIAAAWASYHEKHIDGFEQDEAEEKKTVGALLLISAGVEDPEALEVPADVGQKLLACYDGSVEE